MQPQGTTGNHTARKPPLEDRLSPRTRPFAPRSLTQRGQKGDLECLPVGFTVGFMVFSNALESSINI